MHRALLLVIAIVCVLGITEAKVCPSIDARNEPSALNKLRNCTIIMGHLWVVLMHSDEDGNVFGNYSFPELIEIDEYLVVFSVTKLTSLGMLFPNLRIIRGVKVFLDFALVVWHVDDLREIGLTNLRHIGRGSVIVHKCAKVCFVDTVNWKRLGATNLNFTNTNELCNYQFCRKDCGGYCWNASDCQTFTEERCDPQCIGCTKDNSPSHCLACKLFEANGTCVRNCPPETVANNYSMKCLTEEECTTMLNRTWFIFNKTCVQECPVYYYKTTNKTLNFCKFVGEKYKKICQGPFTVNNIEALENLTKCTHIQGSVEINIHLKEKLEMHLSNIVSISGYLKIAGCGKITSLDFFKKLRMIKGEELYIKGYALFILENRNLKSLWNFTDNSSLTIGNGSVFFQNNEQLCISEIEKLANTAKMKIDLKLFQNSNGVTSLCNSIVDFNVTIVERHPKNVTLKWQQPSTLANETAIGYYIYYIPATKKPIPALEEEDKCSITKWASVFERDNNVTLKKLKPYQGYFFYIKIYTTSNNRGYQSARSLFNTTSSEPTEPRNLIAKAASDSSITLAWKPPVHTNGNLSHYNIVMYKKKDYIPLRNYCHHPHTPEIEEPLEAKADRVIKPATCTSADKEIMQIFQDDSICADEYCKSHIFHDYKPNESSKQVKTHGGFGENKTYNFADLAHFTLYIFYIQACNSANETDYCGLPKMVSARTKKQETADFVEGLSVKVDGNNALLQWRPPVKTNSFLMAYQIEYKRTDLENAKSLSDCIVKEDYKIEGYELHLSSGKYKIRVQAISLAGPGNFSSWQIFEIDNTDFGMYWVWGFLPFFVILVFVLMALLARHEYRKWYGLDNNHLFTNINPDYAGLIYEEDEWEIDRSGVELIKELGHGTFGVVYQGIIKSQMNQCAVKTVNESASMPSRLNFLNEGAVMKSFNDAHHVIKLLGIVSRGQPPLVIMELMERGDLKSYLKRCREPQNLTAIDLYRMAAEIADGMAYLSVKKFVHRDLAARNCMVAANSTVKIGDFGMARDVYETDYYRKETVGLLPVRWMAPESLTDGVFTSNSDIWSYGIVLWEISTLGEQPYQGLSNEQVLQFVSKARGKLERPAECLNLLFEVMEACWRWRPNNRPRFSDIVTMLADHVGEDFRLVAFCYREQRRELALNAPNCFGQYDPTNEESNFSEEDSNRPM